MKTTAWKVFIDYEKEEEWLNAMSAKGLAMKDYFFLRYVFEDSEPGEYTYRIELLNNLPGQAESQNYLSFMADSGVEHVASWHRWVYFRKRTEGGSFDIYSDIDSRIEHYRRVKMLWLVIMIMEIFLGCSNLFIGFEFLLGTGSGTLLNFVAGILVLCLGGVIFLVWNALRQKIKRLCEEQALRE